MSRRHERSEKTAREMFLEHAAAYFDDLKTTTESVPTQQAFDTAEAFCLDKGRELIRQSLEALIQEQIDAHEKKKRRRSVRSANRKNGIGATEPKNE